MTTTGRKPFRSDHRASAACLLMGLCALLFLGGCAAATQSVTPAPTAPPTTVQTSTPVPTATATSRPTATPTPTITPTPTRPDNVSPLTGLVVDPALINRRIVGFRVGNDPSIRPQEGLGAADIVYEEITEGRTVTRFTALFLESEASRVRPLRSARLINLTLMPQYDAALVHTGASDPIRYLLSQSTVMNLDQYFHPKPYGLLPGYDWRGRMYSSTTAVRSYLESRGFERSGLIDGYTFDPEPPDGDAAGTVNIPYPNGKVNWEYDVPSGRYLRNTSGRAHTDALTNEQIGAENVILLYAEHRRTNIVEDVNGATAIDIVLDGSGRVVVIRDGVMVEGEWRRTAPDAVILYWDADGEVIPLKPGKTWIELMPPDYEVAIDA